MLLCSCSTSRKKKKREYHRVENGKAIKSGKRSKLLPRKHSKQSSLPAVFFVFRFFFSFCFVLFKYGTLGYHQQRVPFADSSTFWLRIALPNTSCAARHSRGRLRQTTNTGQKCTAVLLFFFFFAHLGFRRQRKKKKRAYLAAPVFVLLCFVLFSSSCLCSPFRYALT